MSDRTARGAFPCGVIRKFLTYETFILLLLLATLTPVRAAERLNFIFILVDDMGVTDAGCYGSKFYETPQIDRLARDGMKFNAAYSACTVCSPTRARAADREVSRAPASHRLDRRPPAAKGKAAHSRVAEGAEAEWTTLPAAAPRRGLRHREHRQMASRRRAADGLRLRRECRRNRQGPAADLLFAVQDSARCRTVRPANFCRTA